MRNLYPLIESFNLSSYIFADVLTCNRVLREYVNLRQLHSDGSRHTIVSYLPSYAFPNNAVILIHCNRLAAIQDEFLPT